MTTTKASMSHEIVAIALRWFEEVWNQRRREVVYELLTPSSVCESETGQLTGPDGFLEKAYEPFITLFPDLRVTVDDTVAEDDRVVVRWHAVGTHAGEGFNIPPTGRRITIRGMTWMRIKGGKLVYGMDCWNQSGLMQALQETKPSPSIAID